MKSHTILLALLAAAFSVCSAKAQTADEIIATHLEASGGAGNYAKLKGIKTTGSLKQGATNIPLETVTLKDGRQYLKLNFQGTPVYQNVYDGSTFWGTNFQTMKNEKMDAESQKVMQAQIGDFPDALLGYKKKGYKAELLGKETLENQEVYKIKLTKTPVEVNNQMLDQVTYYYFDTGSKLLVGHEKEIQTGPHKGLVAITFFSNYTKVDGLLIPFQMKQGVKGMPLQLIVVENVILNPEVDSKSFQFPG